MSRPPHFVAIVALALATASATGAQQSSAAPAFPAPDVGSIAPDFTLPGATRFGTLRDSLRLSDFRGKTVVLAFFYRARTKG
jgi:peroxiredoxin Q/BCP